MVARTNGAPAANARIYSEADGAAVREALFEDEQERRCSHREAVSRPNMRFVPIKTPDQQAVLALHRARQGLVRQRTAQGNQTRGLLAEYGVTISQGNSIYPHGSAGDLEDAEIALLASSNNC
jgi:transposase